MNRFFLAALAAFSLTVARADTHIRWQDGINHLDLEMRGTVEFTDNDSDVKDLSSDGYFRLEQEAAGPLRLYIVRPGSKGLERLYSVDGASKPLDADARAWLARVLPDVIRESALGAADRVKRILRQSGAAGVFAEIAKIHSDHSRRIYLENLLENGKLQAADLREAMRLTRKIGSDGEKASLLIGVAPHYQNAAARESYFDTVDSISSDGERRRALNAVLDRYGPDPETLALALRSARHINSDGEKAAVLVRAAAFRLTGEAPRAGFFRAADSISSSGEQHRVLSAVLKMNGADKDVLTRALRTASGIASDGEKAAVLSEAAGSYTDDPLVRRAFFDALATINSDGERHRALAALIRGADWSVDTRREAAHSAARMSSDGEKAAVLILLLNSGGKGPLAADAVIDAVNTIHSDGEHARVLLAALNAAPLPRDTVLLVIHSAERISSDGEKTRVLTRIADRYGNDAQVSAALRTAARSITSDGEYRRLMNSLRAGS